MHGGSTVVITGANLARVGGLLGVTATGCEERIAAGATVSMAEGVDRKEPLAFKLCTLRAPENATILASIRSDTPPTGYEEFRSARGRRHFFNERTGHVIADRRAVAVAVEVAGGGRLVVLASAFGVSDELSMPAEELKRWSCWRTWSDCPEANTFCGDDRVFPQPFPMLEHVRSLLATELRATMQLFSVGDGLAFSVNRVRSGEYVLTVSNENLRPMQLNIQSHIGEVVKIVDLGIDVSEKQFDGWLPCGPWNTTRPGSNSMTMIDTADVRVFRVFVQEDAASVAPVAAEKPPALPHGIGLPLRDVRSVRKAILQRPTFLGNFDSLILDHRSLGCVVGRETPWQRYWDCLPSTMQRADRHWLSADGAGPQGLKVWADLTGMM